MTKPVHAVANGMVVVGRASFHRPDCRLVEGKEDLDYASQDEATARGLSPCRVCDPTKPATRQAPGRARARR
jgi:methylphosphotriester-DNA--protein-cysteine methyltransferase